MLFLTENIFLIWRWLSTRGASFRVDSAYKDLILCWLSLRRALIRFSRTSHVDVVYGASYIVRELSVRGMHSTVTKPGLCENLDQNISPNYKKCARLHFFMWFLPILYFTYTVSVLLNFISSTSITYCISLFYNCKLDAKVYECALQNT